MKDISNRQKKFSNANIQPLNGTSLMFHFFGGTVFPLLVLVLLVLFAPTGSEGAGFSMLFAWFGLPAMGIIIFITSLIGICNAIYQKKMNIALIPSFFALPVMICLAIGLLTLLGVQIPDYWIEKIFIREIFISFYIIYVFTTTIIAGIWLWRRHPNNEMLKRVLVWFSCILLALILFLSIPHFY